MPKKTDKPAGQIAADQLKSFIARVERLDEELGNIRNDIKEIFAEAKAHGYDVRTMREILKLKKLDEADREEREQLLELYRQALNL